MDTDRLVPIALALFCVVAIGLAASTLNQTKKPSSGTVGAGDKSTGAPSDANKFDIKLPDVGGGNNSNVSGMSGVFNPCVKLMQNPYFLGAIFLLLGLWLRYLYVQGVGLLGVSSIFVVFTIIFAFIHALLTGGCQTGSPVGKKSGLVNLRKFEEIAVPEGGSGGGSGDSFATPSIIFILVLGGIAVAALIFLITSTSDDEEIEEPEFDEEAEPPKDADISAIGRLAGDAADRIEGDADVTNEVYRAWSRMTHYLDVPNPSSSTPGEFASAAIDAGMAREDVEELTELFDEVRYGGEEATEEREERAINALRNIEEEYASEEEGEDRQTSTGMRDESSFSGIGDNSSSSGVEDESSSSGGGGSE